jgi:hypothetical protein
MPRQPGGITKFERIQAVKTVLDRWGRLEKSQIDEQVAAALNCPAEELKRSLYRDLEELENLREIVAIHYTRDGIELEDYNPEIHRSTICRWSTPGGEHQILGAQKLRECQASFLAARRMRDAFQVVEPAPAPDDGKISLYFALEGRPQCLRLDRSALPAKIVIARNAGELSELGLLELLQEAFGKRTSCLLVPVGNVSKAKDKSQLGHLLYRLSRTRKSQTQRPRLQERNFSRRAGAAKLRTAHQRPRQPGRGHDQ